MIFKKEVESTIDFYNTNARSYAQKISSKIFLEKLNKFKSLLRKGEKILDVGCAAGRDSIELSKRGREVVGIDVSTKLLQIAKENYPKIMFMKMSMTELAFEDESFGGIWSSASLLHLPTESEVKKAISEFYRILKKDGVMYISVKEKIGSKKTEVVRERLSDQQPRFFQYFKVSELEDILRSAGFEIIELSKNTNQREVPISWINIFARKK